MPALRSESLGLENTSYRQRLRVLSIGGGVDVNADCLKKGPMPMGGMPSVGVFLRDPSPYLRELRRKPRKTPHG